MIIKNNRLLIILFVIVTLLLIPIIVMQFTDGMHWTVFDFLVAGVMLFGAGLVCEIVLRKVKKLKFRIALCLTIILLLLLIWAELAVGII